MRYSQNNPCLIIYMMIQWIRHYAGVNYTNYYSETAHKVFIYKKWFRWDWVTKSDDNRTFKVLLRFKKSHKSMNFDISNHIYVVQSKLLFKFVWKTSNLKIKVRELRSKSSSNTSIRRRMQGRRRKNTTGKQGETHLRRQKSSNTFRTRAFCTTKHIQ